MANYKSLPEATGKWEWKITSNGHVVVKANDNKHLFEAKKVLETSGFNCSDADIYIDTDKFPTMCLRGAA